MKRNQVILLMGNILFIINICLIHTPAQFAEYVNDIISPFRIKNEIINYHRPFVDETNESLDFEFKNVGNAVQFKELEETNEHPLKALFVPNNYDIKGVDLKDVDVLFIPNNTAENVRDSIQTIIASPDQLFTDSPQRPVFFKIFDGRIQSIFLSYSKPSRNELVLK